jgi:ribose transport system substrate-binding protein
MTKQEESMESKGHHSLRRLRVALALLAVAVAVVAAGCGSDKSSSNSTSSNANAASTTPPPKNSGLAQAKAFMQQALKPPSTLGLPATGKPIPGGKTVTYVHCGVDVCSTIAKAIKNAASVLGWNAKIIPTDGSPGSVKAAWDTVVRMKPDAAFGSGFPEALFASEAKQLKAEGVPIFEFATTDPTTGPQITLNRGGSGEVPLVGKQMAAWVVSTTEGKANTLYVDLPAFPILPPVRSGFEAAYKQWCPNCPYAKMDLPITSIGKDAPSRIVSYLRAHPDVNRVALGYDGLDFGLPAALKAAGLSGKVQFIGEAPTETNFAYVRAGQEGATVSQGYYEIWANLVDAAARTTTDQSIAGNKSWKVPWFLVTKDNIDSAGTGFGPVVPNLKGEMQTLWDKKA